MRKPRLSLLALAVALWCAPRAHAVQPLFTVGVQWQTQTTKPCAAGQPCSWVDTTNKQFQYYDGTTAKTIPTLAATTKGDLPVFTGTVWSRIAAGTNGYCLKANSGEATGLEWASCAGGGGGTLAADYAAGASQADSTMSLDSTRLGIRIRDNATPISGDLFAIQNSAGSSTFFGVTPSTITAGANIIPNADASRSFGSSSFRWAAAYSTVLDAGASDLFLRSGSNNRLVLSSSDYNTLTSGQADGASARAFTINTTTTWANGTAYGLDVQNNGTSVFRVRASDGRLFGNGNTAWVDMATAGVLGLVSSGGTMSLAASGNHTMSGASLSPGTDLAMDLGRTAFRWGAIYEGNDSVGTTQVVGVSLSNNTAATSGAANQKWSPGLQLTGQQWNGSASVAVDAMIQATPLTGSTNPPDVSLMLRYNAGAWANRITFSDLGGGLGAIYLGPKSSNDYLYGGNNTLVTRVGGTTVVAAETDKIAYSVPLSAGATLRLQSTDGDSGTAVAVAIDTTSAWSTAGNKLVSFRENATEFGYVAESNSNNEFQIQSRASYTTALYGAVSIRLHSTAADGASAVASYVDTSTAWSNGSALLQSWRTNGSQKALLDVAGNIGARGLFNTALAYGVKTVNGFVEITGGNLAPDTDGTLNSGGTSNHWNGEFADFFETHMGSQLTAAASITPTTGFHHVTGATTIDTIAVTNFSGNPTLVLVADGGTITWSAAGNIKAAGTITQDKAQWFIYDTAASKWHPQQ